MTKNVAIDVVISFIVLIHDMFVENRNNGAFGDKIPIINDIIDTLDEIIGYLKELKEAK